MNTQHYFALYLVAYIEGFEFGLTPPANNDIELSLDVSQQIDRNAAIALGTHHASTGKPPLGFFDFSQAWQALRSTDQQQ